MHRSTRSQLPARSNHLCACRLHVANAAALAAAHVAAALATALTAIDAPAPALAAPTVAAVAAAATTDAVGDVGGAVFAVLLLRRRSASYPGQACALP